MSAIKRKEARIKKVSFAQVGNYLILPPRGAVRPTFAVWDRTKGHSVSQKPSMGEAIRTAQELSK